MKRAPKKSSPRSGGARLGWCLDFLRLIWALDHALQRRSKWMETNLSITGPQRLVIRIVGRFPGAPAGLLADVLHLHPSTLTGVLKRLQLKGLVVRGKDPKDLRRSILRLTEKGRRVDVAREQTIEASLERSLGRISPKTLDVVRGVLEDLTRTLEDGI